MIKYNLILKTSNTLLFHSLKVSIFVKLWKRTYRNLLTDFPLSHSLAPILSHQVTLPQVTLSLSLWLIHGSHAPAQRCMTYSFIPLLTTTVSLFCIASAVQRTVEPAVFLAVVRAVLHDDTRTVSIWSLQLFLYQRLVWNSVKESTTAWYNKNCTLWNDVISVETMNDGLNGKFFPVALIKFFYTVVC